MQVKDALVLAGFNPRNLIPGRGKSININVNGSKKHYMGNMGSSQNSS